MFVNFLKCGVVAVVVAAGVWSGGTAKASDLYCPPTYCYKKVVCYENVTSYETRCESYQVCCVKYDCYGCAYNTYETRHRNVQYPVTKQVAVIKYVKVPTYSNRPSSR